MPRPLDFGVSENVLQIGVSAAGALHRGGVAARNRALGALLNDRAALPVPPYQAQCGLLSGSCPTGLPPNP